MNIPRFRAYNTKRNILANVLQLDWANHTVTVLVDSARANQETWQFDEIELNQYLGRYDIFDEEICEGDILAWEEYSFNGMRVDDFEVIDDRILLLCYQDTIMKTQFIKGNKYYWGEVLNVYPTLIIKGNKYNVSLS
jgi:hypothetical protein